MTTGPTDIPSLGDIKDKAADALKNPSTPEVEQAIENTKNFYNRHKAAIHLTALCVVAYKVEKRMVKKVVEKALDKKFKGLAEAIMEDTRSLEVNQIFNNGMANAFELVDYAVTNADKIKKIDFNALKSI